jgi:hypothetical protein
VELKGLFGVFQPLVEIGIIILARERIKLSLNFDFMLFLESTFMEYI